MKINIRTNGGYNLGGINPAGATFTGPVILYADPTQTFEAATKNYVDSSVAVHAALGSIHLDTADKTILDTVTALPTEINQLSGITSNVQTLLNQKLDLTGGTLTGYMILAQNPAVDLEAATKNYLTNTIAGLYSYKAGDIVSRPTSVTPTGFLKCNGAYVAISTYTDLYSAIGHSFDGAGVNGLINIPYTSYDTLGAGQFWRQQYNISPSGDNLGVTVNLGSILPSILAASQAVVTKNRVYLLGGHTAGGYNTLTNIYTAPINADGTIGAWTNDTNTLPVSLGWSQAVVTKNRVYLLGGDSSGSYISSIFTAPINTDGTLGTFTNTGATLPVALGASQVITTKNRVYLLGGVNGSMSAPTVLNSIYTAPINADGTLGAFVTDTNTLPIAVNSHQAIVTQNRVYLLAIGSTTILTALINPDGTLAPFTIDTNTLPVALLFSSSIVTRNKVFLFGGQVSGSCVSTIYNAPINADGTLGTFTVYGNLPSAFSHSQAVLTKNHVYLLGGYSVAASSGLNIVTIAPIDNSGFNDYTKLYDGSINTFDGVTNLIGGYTVFSDNPDSVNYFALPNEYQYEKDTVGLYRYIKY